MVRVLLLKVEANDLVEQFVSVKLADDRTGVIVIGDISRIFRQKIADDLHDRIVTLFSQSKVNVIEHLLRAYGIGQRSVLILIQTVHLTLS